MLYSLIILAIRVMGLTGSGKSSFINKAAGKTVVEVVEDLRSQTRAVQSVRCLHPDGCRNIVLVDTPGFDDTNLSDVQILRIIAHWLKDTYRNNVKLTGLLYLHRISDVRFAGTPLRNLAVFKDLCGDGNLKNIVLVTTMWDEVKDQAVGSQREDELLSDFWKDMIRQGSRSYRFEGTRDSAWEIINRLELEGARQTRIQLQIQVEMVDRGLELHETTAAKTLLRFLIQLAGEFKKAWSKLRNKARRSISPREPSGDLRRHTFLSRSSTIRSTSSMASSSRSTFSSAGLSRVSSRDSTPPPSPAGSICSVNGHRDTLVAAIKVLRVAHQAADIGHIPMLRGVIGTVLHIAQQIEVSNPPPTVLRRS
ncbi:hypothetical protein OG21DRAFT_1406255 [Imleria badia]|nr:hypothetical protein OG21DRAFT_1406255 [Imleria badia]